MTNTLHLRKILPGLALAALVLTAETALAQAVPAAAPQERSELYRFATRFWWLIFPIFGMVMGMIAMMQRHKTANRTIDIIKSYADQGKDPPPELLAALRDPHLSGEAKVPSWTSVFLFGSLAVGFLMFGFLMGNGERDHVVAFAFVALIMAGLCVGKLVNVLSWNKRHGKPQ